MAITHPKANACPFKSSIVNSKWTRLSKKKFIVNTNIHGCDVDFFWAIEFHPKLLNVEPEASQTLLFTFVHFQNVHTGRKHISNILLKCENECQKRKLSTPMRNVYWCQNDPLEHFVVFERIQLFIQLNKTFQAQTIHWCFVELEKRVRIICTFD